MGKYRATVNQPEAKVGGPPAELDDGDPSVRQRVAHGFLVPADDVAREAQLTVVIVEAPVSSKEDVLRALEAARRLRDADADGAKEASSVSTAITEAEEDEDD